MNILPRDDMINLPMRLNQKYLQSESSNQIASEFIDAVAELTWRRLLEEFERPIAALIRGNDRVYWHIRRTPLR